MKNMSLPISLFLAICLVACGGKRETEVPKPPPPPIDENLLNLVPYETDLVIWFDVKKLRTSLVWSLVEKVLSNKSVTLPMEASLRNPLLACDEILMAYLESPTAGDQLLVLAKGDPVHITKMQTTFGQHADAKAVSVETFKGTWSSKMLMVPLTEQTVALGNEVIVRSAAKAGLGESRSVKENAEFDGFAVGGPAAMVLRYRSGVTAPVIEKFKSVVPRINPNAITGVDAAVHVDSGLDLMVNLSTQTQMDASVIAEDLSRARGELKNNMIVLFLGVTWLLDRVNISSEKNALHIDVALDARDISELSHLVERLQKIQELLDDSGGPPFNKPLMRGD